MYHFYVTAEIGEAGLTHEAMWLINQKLQLRNKYKIEIETTLITHQPTLVCKSLKLLNDVIYACACVPLTGMLNILPANTLLVPSNPPKTKINEM